MKNLPEKIYLNFGPDPGQYYGDHSGVTWSEHRIDAGDVEYHLSPAKPGLLQKLQKRFSKLLKSFHGQAA